MAMTIVVKVVTKVSKLAEVAVVTARDLADCCTDTQADSEFGYAGYCILKLAMH